MGEGDGRTTHGMIVYPSGDLASIDPGISNVLEDVDYVIDGAAKTGTLKKYSVTTDPDDTIRQQIIDNLDTRLKTILISNNYKTNIGQHVYDWKTDSIEQTTLPCIVYRDLSAEKVEGIIGKFRWKLDIEIGIATSGATTPDDLREMIQDVLTCIGVDYTFGGLAVYTEQPESNEINIEQQDKIIGDVRWIFSIIYDSGKWET